MPGRMVSHDWAIFTGVFCSNAVYPSYGSCFSMASNISFPFAVSLSIIWFSSLVSLYMWKLSNVFSILPFFVTWTIFIISSMFCIACPLSRWCWANLDFLLLYLKSLICSLNLVLNGLPVCPVYVILQSGQVNWYTLLLSYLHWVLCSMVRRLPIVLFVVNATVTLCLWIVWWCTGFLFRRMWTSHTYVFESVCCGFVFSSCVPVLCGGDHTCYWPGTASRFLFLSVCFRGLVCMLLACQGSTWWPLSFVHWDGMSPWGLWYRLWWAFCRYQMKGICGSFYGNV